jgi:hypothetical protein
VTTQPIHPALRAELDRELSSAANALVDKAAELDGEDVIEANVELTNFLLDNLSPAQLAAAAAMLALRVRRGGEGGS